MQSLDEHVETIAIELQRIGDAGRKLSQLILNNRQLIKEYCIAQKELLKCLVEKTHNCFQDITATFESCINDSNVINSITQVTSEYDSKLTELRRQVVDVLNNAADEEIRAITKLYATSPIIDALLGLAIF